jgi:hypothetical protein
MLPRLVALLPPSVAQGLGAHRPRADLYGRTHLTAAVALRGS